MAARFNVERLVLFAVGVLGLLGTREMRAQMIPYPGVGFPCPYRYYFDGSRNAGLPGGGVTLVRLGYGTFTPYPFFWSGLYYFGNRVSQDRQWKVDAITIDVTCKVYTEFQDGLGYVNVWNIDLGRMQNQPPVRVYASGDGGGCAEENRLNPSGFSPIVRLECQTDDGGDGETPPPPPGSGGGGGGGGAGNWSGGWLRICQSTDYYDGDGNYLYTTSEGCWFAEA